ncbi:MAG: glycoside hydrolase family 15 protein, partial [Propionibacterium sp.]|nr:glycoside hydrolase family 15 protein [Propionibacterium sp.]
MPDDVTHRPAHSTPLEEYALLSDLHTGPLVSRQGSIDWLCFPNFDSPAVFSAILGDPDDGRWQLSVTDAEVTRWRYRGATFILETTWEGPEGTAIVTDLLPTGDQCANLVRRVTCTRGRVVVRHDLRLRPDYNRSSVWLRRCVMPEGDPGIIGIAGPEKLVLRGPLLEVQSNGNGDADHPLAASGEIGRDLFGEFELTEGDQLDWTLSWGKSYRDVPAAVDIDRAIAATEEFWLD